MNLLSHFYVLRPPVTPLQAFGAILPDLVKHCDRSYKIEPLATDRVTTYPVHFQQINKGAIWHYQVDSYFHDCTFFHDNVDFIKEELQNQPLEYHPRFLFFVAHIFLELLLDRMLIQDDRRMCHQFYTILGQVEDEDIFSYLQYQQYVKQLNGFIIFFHRFLEHKYLFHYTNNEAFIKTLNKVIQRTGNKGFLETDFKRLKVCLLKLENHYRQHGYKTIFDEVHEHLFGS